MMKSQEITKKKRYGAIDRGMSLFFVVGMAFGHFLAIGLSAYFIIHFVMNGEPSGWVLIPILLGPFIYADVDLIRKHLLGRFFINYQFCADGIHCSGLGWGRFIIPWSSIHTYGYADTSYPTVSFRFFYFSKDPGEMYSSTKNIAALRKDRLILQHRTDAWEAVKEYMPADMKRNLEDCLRHNRGGCFRR